MFDQNITSITETIWFLLGNTTWKWQKVKNYLKKRNKNFADFLWYDAIPERVCFRAFLTLIFTKDGYY